MPSLLQIHFNFPAELMGPALTAAAMPLAESITKEPGFISKIWTENPRTGEAGGIYLFEDEASASPTPPCTSSGCSPWAPARCSSSCSTSTSRSAASPVALPDMIRHRAGIKTAGSGRYWPATGSPARRAP